MRPPEVSVSVTTKLALSDGSGTSDSLTSPLSSSSEPAPSSLFDELPESDEESLESESSLDSEEESFDEDSLDESSLDDSLLDESLLDESSPEELSELSESEPLEPDEPL